MANKTNEEGKDLKEEYKAKLDFCVSEYKWLKGLTKEEAIKEIRLEAQKIRAMINGEKSEEQRYYLKYYNRLIVKDYLINNERYESMLLGDIMVLTEKIKQIEIDNMDFTFGDYIKGVLGKDEEKRKVIELNRLIRNYRINGVQKETNYEVQPVEQLIDYMRRYNDWVGLTMPEKEQEEVKAMVLSKGHLSPSVEKMSEYVFKEYLLKEEHTDVAKEHKNIEGNEISSERKSLNHEQHIENDDKQRKKDDKEKGEVEK